MHNALVVGMLQRLCDLHSEVEGFLPIQVPAPALNELLDGERLPKMDALKEKRRKLAARKKALYAEYRAAQQEMREAVAVKANIDHLLGLSDERKNKEQER